MRAVVISENLGPPLDEGIRKFATLLVDGLSAHCDAFGIATGEWFAGDAEGRITHAPGGKLFRTPELAEALRRAEPDLVVYVPSASGTLFSFLRARALKAAAPGARVAMVLTQARRHLLPVKRLLSRLAPDAVFCQSAATMRYLASAGIEATFLPSAVDTGRFHPVSGQRKADLRRFYGLPQGEYLVLHAGHLKRGRNTELLAQLEGIGRGVMLAGRSMGLDSVLKRKMKKHGVVVIDKYVERVEELFQACDAYLFPVREEDSAMEFPLSVLEAMSCDLAVAANPYGGLPLALREGDGLSFAQTDEGLIDAVRRGKDAHVATRAQAEMFGWDRTAGLLLEATGVRDAGAFATTV